MLTYLDFSRILGSRTSKSATVIVIQDLAADCRDEAVRNVQLGIIKIEEKNSEPQPHQKSSLFNRYSKKSLVRSKIGIVPFINLCTGRILPHPLGCDQFL